jgi:hypothetical protein
MAKNNSRKSKLGLFRRLYSPLNHVVGAVRNTGKTLFTRSGRIVNEGLGGIQNIGRSIPAHLDGAVHNLTSRRRRDRKNKKNTRKNRRNSAGTRRRR